MKQLLKLKWIRNGLVILSLAFLFSMSAQAQTVKSARPKSLQLKRVQIESKEMSAFVGKTISTIDVRGLSRIEKEAVLAKISSKIGEPLSESKARNDIQALFAMGYFDDIEVQTEMAQDREKINLIYVLRERPVISKIEFEGNERISTSDLQDVTKIKEWSILNVNKVKEDLALLQKHYEEKGFYLAKVSFDVKPVKKDQVELVYKINDYEKVQIKKITFLNNKAFSDEKLKGVFRETHEGGLFSFMSGAGNFKESAFKMDLNILTYWYLEHGYVKFRYETPVITVSDDKKWLYVSIYLEEGEPYKMGKFDFGGELLFPKEEHHSELTLKPGDLFGVSKRNADIQRLTEKYQDLGYAFVNVIPKMDIHDDSKTVDIEYNFEKGNLVYFGEITILGNSKTHDKVIRREIKIHEGELYNGTRLRESRENVERLGFFAPGEVIFNTISPKDKPDVVNVEVLIKERSTGTITLGAGYGSGTGFFFTGQVSEINLFGKGQNLSLAAQLARERNQKSINLGFTDPYAFDTRWSMGFDTFFVTNSIPDKWNTRRLGFDLRFGYPIYEFTSAYFTYKNEGVKLEDVINGNDPAIQEDLKADAGVLSSVTMSVVRDKRNNRFETTAGNYQSVSVETAGLGGDKKFVKWSANSRYYRQIVGDLVFRNSFEYGQIHEVGGNPIPPSERFYLGGPNNLKGFGYAAVGPKRPRVTSTGISFLEPLGGNVEMLALFELEYPLLREAGLKWVMFYDLGNVFTNFPKGDEFKLRSDAGFGIRWFSPIGPLRFEWGFPLKRGSDEDEFTFTFFIGPPF